MRVPIRIDRPDGVVARVVVPLVFIAAGVGMIYWFEVRAALVPGWPRAVPVIMGGLFILSGLGSFFRSHRRRREREKALRTLEIHQDEPWLVRPAWRKSELVAPSAVDGSFLAFTLVWNVLTWPLAFLLLTSPDTGGQGSVWLLGLFPAVGLGMVAKVLVDVRRGRKLGRTVLVLDPMPARLGWPIEGNLTTEGGGGARPERGVLVELSCYRQYVRRTRESSGRLRSRIERDLIWRDEVRVDPGSHAGGAGLAVPFAFRLPEDRPASTPLETETRILWEISAQAELPGVDLSTAVEIPVFPPDPEAGPPPSAVRGTDLEAAGGSLAWPIETPVTPGIRLADDPDAFELHFAASRTRSGALILGFAGALTVALGVALLPGSFLFAVVLLALGALLVFGSLQQATNDTVLRIRDGLVEVSHDGIGMPADVSFPAANLESVEVHLGGGTGSGNRGYSISLVARSTEGLEHLEEQAHRTADLISRIGAPDVAIDALRAGADRPMILVAGQLEDKAEADWLARKIHEAARRSTEE